jgi:hypothetical protein
MLVLVAFLNSTLNCAFTWTQQADGLYPQRYFFWAWHHQYALVSAVRIFSHVSKVQQQAGTSLIDSQTPKKTLEIFILNVSFKGVQPDLI